MRRNIIFRGRELATGTWYEGCLVANCRAAYIVTLGGHSIESTEVDPDTVQQLTNCYYQMRQVWEGDVFTNPAKPDNRYTVYYDIVFDAFRIRWSDSKNTSSAPLAAFLAAFPRMEYIGNIADLTDNTDKP